MRFHQRRQFLLESLRLAFQIGYEDDADDEDADVDNESPEEQQRRLNAGQLRTLMRNFIALVLNFGDHRIENASKFWDKCISGMDTIEKELQKVGDRMQRASIVGQNLSLDEEQIMEYEKNTLDLQHESLGAITAFLVQHGSVFPDNFRRLLGKVKQLNRHDSVMLHYLPVLGCLISQFGGSAATCSEDETKALHQTVIADRDTDRWGLRSLHRAVLSWWIVEYKGRFPPDTVASADADLEILAKSLKEGGLQFMLSVAQDIKKNDWHDQAKIGLTGFLLRDAAVLPQETARPAAHFQTLLARRFQVFIDAFISNTPDTLRLLKFEEDNRRKELRSRFQNTLAEYEYHLDTFLVLVAYSYEGDPDSAKEFWADRDSNLFGFLQWSAKRQTTPRAAAFCEMLRSLSEGPENAESAHKFLLEEGGYTSGKLRRSSTLSWNQILAELDVFQKTLKERTNPVLSGSQKPGQQTFEQIVEPESAIMLECYLRLISHLCVQSDSAREFLLRLESPAVPNLLLDLYCGGIEPRLQACIFNAMATFLSNKTADVSNHFWILIDAWIPGNNAAQALHRLLPSSGPATTPEEKVFKLILNGHEVPTAFMHLLTTLVTPIASDEALNDAIPFPESLGAAYRRGSIDLYVDFAMGRIFVEKTKGTNDQQQLRLIRLRCLDFICACLSTFNEDLVVIANRSSFPVEAAMRCSSLDAYVHLHPFARVMEWLFEDKVLDALFAATHQDVEEVNRSATDSPLVVSLIRSIETMNLVMKLQTTYLDIVRPLIQKSAKKPVTRSPVSSFEEAVLKHIDFVVDIGLYTALGHPELAIVSLSLLERLASSRQLMLPPSVNSKRLDRNRLITVLEKNDEAERIASALAASMKFNEREFEAGPESPGFIIKSGIVSFIRNCLRTMPDRPTIAHLLLGFSCRSDAVYVGQESPFESGLSLFHAITRLAIDFPDKDETSFISWSSNLKEACVEVLRILWHSPLTNGLAFEELLKGEYIFLQTIRQVVVSSETLFDGFPASHPQLLFLDGGIALGNFFRQRTAYYDFYARSLHFASTGKLTGLRKRLEASLLGTTTFPGDGPQSNPTVLDLFDFMELENHPNVSFPNSRFFVPEDFAVCKNDGLSLAVYEISRAQEVIQLRRNQVSKSLVGTLVHNDSAEHRKELVRVEENESKELEVDATNVQLFMIAENHKRSADIARAQTLEAWSRLITVALRGCQFDQDTRAIFIHQAFQGVLPKFDRACSDGSDDAALLGNILSVLMTAHPDQKVDSTPPTANGDAKGTNGTSTAVSKQERQVYDAGNDNEFQVFRCALNAIAGISASADLRQICYRLCSQYLQKASPEYRFGSVRQKHVVRNAKLVGDKVVERICEDAFSDNVEFRVSAFLLLDALVATLATDSSRQIFDAFERMNFVGLLVDSIRQISNELRSAPATGKSLECSTTFIHLLTSSEITAVLAYHHACLALILRISQTRRGSSLVLQSGIFQAIRESQVFSADPDVGLGKIVPPIARSCH
jgi:nuclear pore complex protein Nup205